MFGRLTPRSRALALALTLTAGLIAGNAAAPPPVHAAALVVNTLANTTTTDGLCSLREAITNANNDAGTFPDCPAGLGADTITFSVSGTITLGSALPNLTSTITINGAGQKVVVNGQNSARPFNVLPGANVTIANLTVENGFSFPNAGGAISNSGTLTVRNTTLRNNTTGGTTGGAISNLDGAVLTVVNSTLHGNTGSVGGGIFNRSQATIINSTITGNLADIGGGIRNFDGAGTTTVSNSVVAENASFTAGPDCGGNITVAGVSLVQNTAGCALAGGALLTGDPLLGPLQDNGGPTFTRAPQPGSPLLNAGDAAICAAAPVSGLDQRGAARPSGPGCEIGALEMHQFVVNDLGGATDGAPGNGVCATAGAVCTLRAAMAEAIALTGQAELITFSVSGTVTLGSTLPLVTTLGGPVLIDGSGQTVTVSGNNAVRIFAVGTGALALHTLTMANGAGSGAAGVSVGTGSLTVTNSTFTGNNGSFGGTSGGGAIGGGGTFVVANSTITGNTAGWGAGIDNAGGSLTVTNSTIAGNTATDAALGGGGIRGGGTLRNTIVAGNTAPTGPDCMGSFTGAGANLVQSTAGCTVSGTLLVADPLLAALASNGGPTQTRALASNSPAVNAGDAAICSAAPVSSKDQRGNTRVLSPGGCDLGAYETATFVVNDLGDAADASIGNGLCATGGAVCTLRAAIQEGLVTPNGGIYFSGPGTITLASALPQITAGTGLTRIDGRSHSITVSGNNARRHFNVAAGAALTVENLTLANGNAGSQAGGSILNDGTVTLRNSLLRNNQAVGGGAVINAGTLTAVNTTFSGNISTLGGGAISSFGPATLTNTTITGNSAGEGGGISRFTSSVTLRNSLIAGNTAPSSPDCSGTITLSGPNLIGNTTACGISGTAPITGAALLAALASNGGPTQTHALQTGSPALNAGDAAICAEAAVGNKDQRGLARPQGPGCDLGAYEAPQLTINNVTANETNAGFVNVNFTVSLSAAPLAGSTVTVSRATADGTAIAPGDYTALAAGTLTFNPGETTKLVTVQVTGDTTFEPNETFFVDLSNATNAVIVDAQGLGTITNDDAGIPDINVTPNFINFGNWGVNTTSPAQQVTVQNTGTAALNVGTITFNAGNPGDFVKSADTCSGQSVAPAGQCTFSIAFAPTALGGSGTNVTIPSNDPDENPVVFPVSGTGAIIGGKNLTITTGSIDLSWDGGTAQTDYTLLQYNTSTAAANLIPVAGAATSYSDAAVTNGVVYCYVLAALNGPTFLGLSDLLCGMAGQESGTVIPQDFNLKLGGTATATITWAAPVGGADSYLLQVIPLDGSPITNVPLGGGITTSNQGVTPAGTCFQLIAFKGAGFGTSDVLCGVPGVGTLGAANSGARTAIDALGDVAALLSNIRLSGPAGPTRE